VITNEYCLHIICLSMPCSRTKNHTGINKGSVIIGAGCIVVILYLSVICILLCMPSKTIS